MKEFAEKYLRKCARIGDFPILLMIYAFFLIVMGQLVGDSLIRFLFGPEEAMSPQLETFTMYFSFIGIWIVVLLMMLRKLDRPMFQCLMPNKTGNTPKWLLIGLLIGAGMNVAAILASILLKDIAVSFRVFEPLWLIAIFLAVVVQAGGEELVCRLYVYQRTCRRYKNPAAGFVVSAVFFALIHSLNDGIRPAGYAHLVLDGIIYSMLVYFFDSFWGAVMAHTGWNFTQHLLFGLPNSGKVAKYSLLGIDAASDGFFFDTVFGIEGGWGTVLLQLIVAVCIFLYGRSHRCQCVDIWAEQEQKAIAKEAAEAMA